MGLYRWYGCSLHDSTSDRKTGDLWSMANELYPGSLYLIGLLSFFCPFLRI